MFLSKFEDFRPDTVSPHDRDALAALDRNWQMEVRLPDLIRGAARSRRLAEQHKHAAWRFIREAQSARQTGDQPMHQDYLGDAMEARRKAAECAGYARRCEQEANAIAIASGFLR